VPLRPVVAVWSAESGASRHSRSWASTPEPRSPARTVAASSAVSNADGRFRRIVAAPGDRSSAGATAPHAGPGTAAHGSRHLSELYIAGVSFAESYLGRLRARVGSRLLLMPGAMVVLERPDGHVLVTKRTDNGHWCLPAGAAEPGGSFAETAIVEAREEVGVEIARDDLRVFGTLSDADKHTIEYPNGDLTHCFAVLFAVQRWHGTPTADGEEVREIRFVDPSALPAPMMSPAAAALELFLLYRSDGQFQLA
jgi:8-oxo-dGTP pyrophosphatase MutT (NUDIX family)